MRNFKTTKQIVKNLLEQDRTLADDIKELVWRVWEEEVGCVIYQITFQQYKNFTSEGSIDRIKRILEKFHPELRGDTYSIRKHIKEPEVRDLMNAEKEVYLKEIELLIKKQ